MKKKFFYSFIFLLILISHLWNFKYIEQNQSKSSPINKENLINYVDLDYHEQELVQTIIAEDNNLNKIIIYLDPIDGKYDNSGYKTLYLKLSLKDEKGAIIEEYKYEKVFFYNKGILKFQFPTIEDSKDKKYYLHITSYRENKIPIKLIFDETSNNNLYIDGELNENQLIFRTEYETSKVTSCYYYFTFAITIIFLVVFIFHYIKGSKYLIHKQYLILSIPICLFMIILTPLYLGNDEIEHFGRAYELSNGKLISSNIDGWPATKVPQILVNMKSYNYRDMRDNFYKDFELTETKNINMEFTAVYSIFSYVPQIVGIWGARLFSLSLFILPYICRIVQSIFCILLVYNAIKIIPFGKNILFLISFLPPFVQSMTLISADASLICCSILFIAKILQIVYEKKKYEKSDIMILLLLSAIISISKLVYFPLSLLLLLIPSKLGKKNNLKIVIFIILFSLIITFVWNMIASLSLLSGQGINVGYYINHYLSHPLELIQITIYTFYNQFGNFISDLFGGINDWADNKIYDSTIFPILFIGLYIYLIINGQNKLRKNDKYMITAILIITYLLISITLLFTCTPVYYKEILGIQGRYFIPFLLPIYLIFANKKKEKLNLNFTMIIILIYFMYYLRYFVLFL